MKNNKIMKLSSLFLTIILTTTFISSCQINSTNSSSNSFDSSTTSENRYETTLGVAEDVRGIKDIVIYDSGRSIFHGDGYTYGEMFPGIGFKDDNILYANMTYYFVINLINEKEKSISVNNDDITVDFDSEYFNIYPDTNYLYSPPVRTYDDYCSKNAFFVETKLPIDSISVTFTVNNFSKDIKLKILDIPDEIYVNRFSMILKKTVNNLYSVPTYIKCTSIDEFYDVCDKYVKTLKKQIASFDFENNFLLMLFLEDGTYVDYQLDFAFIDYNNDLCLEFLGEHFDPVWYDGVPPQWAITGINCKIYMLQISKQYLSYPVHIRCSFYQNIDVNIYF